MQPLTKALLFAYMLGATASAQSVAPAPPTEPGTNLTVSLVTVGVGSEVWELFGHNAIWIHNSTTGADSIYNWGVFDPRAPHFYYRFLRGRMYYMMDTSQATLEGFLWTYRYYNRTVWAQQLNLTPAERWRLQQLIWWNKRPENATYRYDYFRDNCATRIRDVIDRAVNGSIRPQMAAVMTGQTYRTESMRLMQGDLAQDIGVDIGLARPTDRELSAWDESFLPTKLMEHFRAVSLDGGARKLVSREMVLFQSTHAPEPESQPPLGSILLAIGLGAAVVLAATIAFAGTSRVAAWTAAVLISLIGVSAGILGCAVAFLWFGTDHMASHYNENLLLLNPIWLAVGPLLARGVLRRRVSVAGLWCATAVGALALTALLLHAARVSRQDDWAVIGLVLPTACVLWAAGGLLSRRPLTAAR